MSGVKNRVDPLAFRDWRTAEQRRHSDNIEEGRWRSRIWLKQARRNAQSRREIPVDCRLGPMGPDRQGGIQPQPDMGPIPQPDSEPGSHPTNPTWKLLLVRSVRDGWTTLRRLREGQEAAK